MNRKPDLRAMVIEGVAMVPDFLHLSFTAYNTTLSPFSPCEYFIMPTMWNFSWQNKLSLDVTVLFLMQMDKLVCRKSGSNQEAIGDQWQLGSDGGATMEST